MPLIDIQVCLLEDVLPLVVKFLGIADGNYPEGTQTAPGAPYTVQQVKKLIFQADYEIPLLITGNLEHPYRTNYLTGETDYLTDGAIIPAHFGLHSKVTVKHGEAPDEIIEPGMQRDYSRIKRIKQNRAVYGSPANLYAIFGGRIHFAGLTTVGKLDIPQVTKDLSLTTLISPLPYLWAVVASAIAHAAMPGYPENHRQYWAGIWQIYERAITGGALAIPVPEQLERIGA